MALYKCVFDWLIDAIGNYCSDTAHGIQWTSRDRFFQITHATHPHKFFRRTLWREIKGNRDRLVSSRRRQFPSRCDTRVPSRLQWVGGRAKQTESQTDRQTRSEQLPTPVHHNRRTHTQTYTHTHRCTHIRMYNVHKHTYTCTPHTQMYTHTDVWGLFHK